MTNRLLLDLDQSLRSQRGRRQGRDSKAGAQSYPRLRRDRRPTAGRFHPRDAGAVPGRQSRAGPPGRDQVVEQHRGAHEPDDAGLARPGPVAHPGVETPGYVCERLQSLDAAARGSGRQECQSGGLDKAWRSP